jgi:hypothetical protein
VRARHVWVRPDDSPTELAGLILGWRQADGAWEAQVAYVDPRENVSVRWLPASAVRPIEAKPRTGSAYD